jgi:uncharacterized protein (DUF302 family)
MDRRDLFFLVVGELGFAPHEDRDMSYYFSKTVNMDFDAAIAAIKDALKRSSFRILTEIDMKAGFRSALQLDFRPYLILGVHDPELTYRALRAEDKIGAMLPFNIVLQQQEPGRVEISAVDPVASMQAIPNVEISQIAQDARSSLQRIIDEIETEPSGGGR